MQALRSHIVAIVISLGLTIFFFIQHKNPESLAIFNDLEHLAYNVRLKYTYLEKPSNAPTILVVDIDDESLAKEGRWPWSRQKIAQLTARLHAAGVAVISFDINFSGHEQNPITQLLQQKTVQMQDHVFRQRLQQLKTTVDADQHFTKQLQVDNHAKTVLGFLLQEKKNPVSVQTSLAPSPIIIVNNHSSSSISSIRTAGYLASLKQFQQAATGNGFLSIRPDSDGALRHAALVMQHKNTFYPSLALETLRVYKNEKNIYLNTIENNDSQSINYINVGITSIDTNSKGEIMIPYAQAKTAFRTYSATTLLQEDIPFDTQPFAKSIVFIGSSASRLNDLKTTPFSVNYPGVYIQALITQALFEPTLLPTERTWQQGEYAVLYFILAFGLLLSVSLAFFNALSLRFMPISLPIIFVIINFYLWSIEQLNIPLVTPLALMLAIITTHL